MYGVNGTKDKTLKIRGNPKVFFDMTIGGEPAGRIMMQLRDSTAECPDFGMTHVAACRSRSSPAGSWSPSGPERRAVAD